VFLRPDVARSVTLRPTNGQSSSVCLTDVPQRALMMMPTAAARVGTCRLIGGSWRSSCVRRLGCGRDGQRERPPHSVRGGRSSCPRPGDVRPDSQEQWRWHQEPPV